MAEPWKNFMAEPLTSLLKGDVEAYQKKLFSEIFLRNWGYKKKNFLARHPFSKRMEKRVFILFISLEGHSQ